MLFQVVEHGIDIMEILGYKIAIDAVQRCICVVVDCAIECNHCRRLFLIPWCSVLWLSTLFFTDHLFNLFSL